MRDYTHNLLPARPTQRGPSAVPLLIILSLIGWVFVAFSAFAQSSESTAVSGANSEVQVITGAAAGSAINNYGQKPGTDNRTYQEVATAPSLGGLALGGGHPCAYSPATAQISIVGGGAGIGGSKVDSACMLMVMGAAGDAKAYRAAQLMLAARDPAACAAMEAAGIVTCEKKRSGATKPAPVAAASSKGDTGVKCVLKGRTLTFRSSAGGDRDAELVACKARYGL
jgi:hypothetical protein